MKATRAMLALLTGAALLAGACSAKKTTRTTIEDLEQQMKGKNQEITELQSSMKQMESDLQRKEAEAKAKAEAASKAERAAREAEERARAAEAAAKSAQATGSSTAPSVMAGMELFPPNAKPGECYARVFVPPTYTTDTERVLKSEATERIEVVPAKYEWAEERVMVKAATTRLEQVPAKYEWVEEKILVKPAQTLWKRGRGPVEKIDDATGEIMCLVEVPATYNTVKKKVEVQPASTRTVEIPAEYKTVKVQRVVSPASERRIQIPAEYGTVTKTRQITEGRMEWREVLCETNMSRSTVSSIQRALKDSGHDPGPIDGIYGRQTRAAVRSYQEAKGLPTGGITMGTIKQLGVRI